jgi:hypothetical protein
MASTINLDDDYTGADDLRLMQTRRAILEKLKVRFGEYSSRKGWTTLGGKANESRTQRRDYPH